MTHAGHGWYAALVASTAGFVIGCNDAPAAPESSADAREAVPQQAVAHEGRGPAIPFAALKLFLEFNSTDNDLGVQVFLDAEDWERVSAFDPRNQKILDIVTEGRLERLGLTELRFESAEPSPGEVLGLFPQGRYRFAGETVEDQRLQGTAMLSHDLPRAPVITAPASGEPVDRNNVVIRWNPIPGLAGFQVIVSNADLGVQMELDVKPSVTSLKVPPTFLEPGTTYAMEVLSVAKNGNKTITESSFVTRL